MNSIDILNPIKDFELTLCKPNKFELGILSTAKVTSIKKVIDDIDSISFEISNTISDRFYRKNIANPLYDELHEERLICLNNEEYYVVKSIDEEKGDINKKSVSAFSLEQKLNRINITLEDVAIVLTKEDVEDSELAILELLYSETGWSIGHVDEEVRFDIIDGEKVKKVRWQESVSETWYSLLTQTISDIFNCAVFFNTKDKVVDIYSLDTLGENIGLYLSNDNYMKSIQRQSSTDEIVTRLSLTGKDEIDIHSVNPMGKDYVEDYSYFIENDDMSDELVKALEKHNSIVEKNQSIWEDLSKEKQEKNTQLTTKTREHKNICEEIKALISMKNAYEQNEDHANAERIQAEIDEKILIKENLESEIRTLELRILEISDEIEKINMQMDRIYATDENGDLIFPKKLLSELNEFLYYDTYSNTCYLTPKDLMDGGKRELLRRCSPTVEYSLDSINFLNKVSNNKDISFNGTLSMGDIAILYEEDSNKETLLYFVGYEYNLEDKTLNITLSNKKTKINNTKTIADYLKQARNSKRFVDSKSYIFNQVKYNKF